MIVHERRGLGRRTLIAATGGLLAAPAIVRAQGKAGVALVIGNSKYQWEAALPNVQRDAPDVAKRFRELGLQTELVMDATRATMEQAIERLRAASSGANLAAFYFAGHGASWERAQYLVPVDGDLGTPNTVKTFMIALTPGAATRGAAHRLLIYDNCRNNPADGWRQVDAERGAVQTSTGRGAPPETLVLFSTAPGHVALDGPPGQNSPFAAAFLRQMNDPSVDLQSLSSRLRRDLLIATQGRQVLFDRNGLSQPFSINGSPRPGSAAAGGAGWGSDPSRIVELPNAYAYAHENGLSLPSGLIAHRLAGNSPDSQKVGAFKFTNRTPLGNDPALIVVMSVEQGRIAELIISSKGIWDEKTGKMGAGSVWRYVTATVSGDRLEFVPRAEAARLTFKWSDANGGTYSAVDDSAVGGNRSASGNSRFTRLD